MRCLWKSFKPIRYKDEAPAPLGADAGRTVCLPPASPDPYYYRHRINVNAKPEAYLVVGQDIRHGTRCDRRCQRSHFSGGAHCNARQGNQDADKD
jgi:hypothetical protein